jgi:hypothetical protein
MLSGSQQRFVYSAESLNNPVDDSCITEEGLESLLTAYFPPVVRCRNKQGRQETEALKSAAADFDLLQRGRTGWIDAQIVMQVLGEPYDKSLNERRLC